MSAPPPVTPAELLDAASTAAIVLLAALVASRLVGQRARDLASSVDALLGATWLPLAVGILSALAVWYVAGSMQMMPVIHDEWAYVLQAKIFAHGRLAWDARPLPDFFQQMYLFVTPFLGAKYPPGHSLVLTPGVAIGLPALMPIVLAGVSGATLFALARRVTNGVVALLTWSIWLTTPATLNWYASYFSQTTTSACFLVGWYALLRYRSDKSLVAFAVLGVAVGLIAITRPLTAVAYALPTGIAALLIVRHNRRWPDIAAPLLACVAVLLLLPLHNAATTGNWRETPLMMYTQLYTPFDLPTLGYHYSGTTLSMPPDQEWLRQYFIRLRAQHTLSALPGILVERVAWIGRHMWSGWRLALLPAALIGLVSLPVEAVVAMIASAMCLLVMLIHSHDAQWTNYYLEVFAPLAFVTALGMWRAIGWIAARAARSIEAPRTLPLAATALALAFLICPPFYALGEARAGHALAERAHREWFAKLAAIPKPAMVFVRYNYRHHNSNITYVLNTELDLRSAPIWSVYDRGEENEELMRLFPERAAYLYDEKSDTFTRLAR